MFAHYSMEKDENVVISIISILSYATMLISISYDFKIVCTLYFSGIERRIHQDFDSQQSSCTTEHCQIQLQGMFNPDILCSQKEQYVVATLSILPSVSPSIFQQLLSKFWRKIMGIFNVKKKCAYQRHVKVWCVFLELQPFVKILSAHIFNNYWPDFSETSWDSSVSRLDAYVNNPCLALVHPRRHLLTWHN